MVEQVSKILKSNIVAGENGVVCFGDSDWWYHNHGHMDIQLMRRFARYGVVLYVNSIVVRKFNIGEGRMFLRRVRRKLGSILRGLKSSGINNLMVYSPFSLPVHHIPVAHSVNRKLLDWQIRHYLRKLGLVKPLVWVTCPAAAEIAIKLPRTRLVYQRSDRYEALPGINSESVKRCDRLLKKNADLVVYVNRALMVEEQADCRKAIFLDHGVDYETFANAHLDKFIPEEMQRIPHPIVGFYGGIDAHTSNVALIEQVADLLSEFSIVLIGNSSVDLSSLGRRNNVFLISQKPYQQIPHYAKCFDVCFMAWQINEWIAGCNPVKLKEYLALGKPVVSTPFNELDSYLDVVETASDAVSFAKAVRKALKNNNSEQVQARRCMVKNCTWDEKSAELLRVLSNMR
jgi:glycosyltransferase involved in cell wall biosynthesis